MDSYLFSRFFYYERYYVLSVIVVYWCFVCIGSCHNVSFSLILCVFVIDKSGLFFFCAFFFLTRIYVARM